MQVFLRMLLFILCISISSAFHAVASETEANTPEKTEVLERAYTQINSDQNSTFNFSVFRSLDSIIQMIQARSYSLLNWTNHSRSGSLEIENYDRKLQFGPWINDPEDETCYNTRAKVLIRDSNRNVVFKDSNHCGVDAGVWHDPYTDHSFKIAKEIQIDHLVPLKNAYLSGAYRWNFRARCLYANYLGAKFHLLSVNGTENMRKGDKSPDRYMPPNAEYSCTYVKNWLSVKFLWGLRMTTAESTAILNIIKENHCSVSDFRMTAAEVLKQARFVKDNMDLCDNIKNPDEEN